MSKSAIWSIVALVIVIAGVILAIIFIPGSGKNKANNKTTNSSLTASQKAADAKTIKSNFSTFFAAATPMSQRESLLQNGSQFAQPMQAEFTQLGAQNPSITINSVSVTSANVAKVDYTVNLNGNPVLKNQPGEAVKVNGKWLVSDSTLCQLFSLGGQQPAACKNIQ